MASLLLSVGGAAAGNALFGPVGAIVGRLAGAVAGNLIDQALLGGGTRHIEGPRLSDLDVMASTEGAPIPRIYGRARISGQVIWATDLEEVRSEKTEGSKGGGGGGTTTTTYRYFANFAVGLCEGPISHVSRIWADGKLLDLTNITWRFYPGHEAQEADPLIVARQGPDVPAYRGLAYIVFERLPLEDFGNRIPQLSFELVRPVGALEHMTRAVTLIPGTTENGYDTTTIVRVMGLGSSAPENRHVTHADTDVLASLDELQALCPNLERVAIVVAWFGNDLRAEQCQVKPGVEIAHKPTSGTVWSVNGVDRAGAHLVSTVDGRPAYGGTPSDVGMRRLIAELKARGLKVTLYPFVMMDVPASNALPNPWTGAAPQPPYPWRGRITCHPAPGVSGSPDGTATAAAQVNALFGTAQPGDFAVASETVNYSGPPEWSLRRMVLHYAHLAQSAGGVDAFLIGSELRGLTRVRSASGVYPAVSQLTTLAEDVKALLGSGTIVTYAADWTEYGAHVVDAAAQEVRFPLDALWASPAIDAVGIDYYAPLADWRDDATHLDRALAQSPYDRTYLADNLARGEGYDWYYTDDAARAAQLRTAITDGAYGKPWLFRAKDLWNWWSQPHVERVSGIELGSATAWAPQSKPIWLTEVGCAAVDKGANQPSVFPDPKSSENHLPYFSNGSRDDLIQRRLLEAVLTSFDSAYGATLARNPVSAVYGGRMIDASAIHLWTWDARPYPIFPAALDVWSDGGNWETGHWLTGRLGGAPLADLVTAVLADAGITNIDASALRHGIDGYVIDRPMSPRAALDPLALAFAFEAHEDGALLRFTQRGGAPVAEVSEDDVVLGDHRPPFRLLRAQETELPRQVALAYTDSGIDYRRAAVTSRRLVSGSARTSRAELAAIASDAVMQQRAEVWLQDVWAGRESIDFALPPSALRLAPGDVLGLTANGRRRLIEVREVTDAAERRIRGRAIDPEIFDLPLRAPRRPQPPLPPVIGPAHVELLELPTLPGESAPPLLRAAVFADPWPGPVAIWRSFDGASFERIAMVEAPAVIGQTLDPLAAGPVHRWDRANRFQVRLHGGALPSAPEAAVLGGANAAAVRTPCGAWEVLQFANAQVVDSRTYELSTLLRGQAGSEWTIAASVPAGAAFVLLDRNVISIAQSLDLLRRPMHLRVIAASRNHGDPSAVALTATPGATALRPLAPVHVHGVRTVDGIRIGWTRRGRFDADGWEAEVPVGEQSEAYAVDILNSGDVVRTISAAIPNALYASADEVGDFGALQPSLSLRVSQLSQTVGSGVAAEATLTHLG
jgi:hypothetical protein